MVSKFKLIKDILFHKKDPAKVEAAKESARVIALKRQVETLNDINESYADQIKFLSKEVSKQKDGDMQQQLLNMAMNLFQGNNSQSNLGEQVPQAFGKPVITASNECQTKLESGRQYSDDQLIEIAQSLPPTYIQQLKGMAFDQFCNIIKSQIPDISETSLKRSREIVEAMP